MQHVNLSRTPKHGVDTHYRRRNEGSTFPMKTDKKMERAKGFESSHESEQAVDEQASRVLEDLLGSRIESHISDSDRRDLARIVGSWSKLHPAVKSAFLGMVCEVEG